ncbi:MAG TPA: thiamine phosphate synthase [Burkholderiales bacterium]
MSTRITGLYAITPDLCDTDVLCGKVDAALAGGARVVQYRNKTAAPALRREQASRLLALCNAHRVPLIVNDDLALALEIGADGVHLGKDDGAVAPARTQLGGTRLLGVSCYDSVERGVAAVALGADYVAFGSVYPSRVKPDAVRAGMEVFTAARQHLSVPIVAIGGITLQNADELVAAKVDAVAVISALFDAPDVRKAAQSFTALFQRSI